MSFANVAENIFLGPKHLAESTILAADVSRAFSLVSSGLEQVENRIASRFASDASELQVISQYLLDLGGKRVRPLLALLSARAFGMHEASKELIDAASGIELIHMATLLHDDIIDRSPTRRKKESAYIRFGFTPSLLAGDFLWVRAFGLCAHLGEFVVQATEKACVELTEGEILEGKLSPKREFDFDEYVNLVSKKTGSLFWLSALVGAHFAGASKEAVQRVSHFGRYAGIAFQMIDDVLDVVADEDLLGKPCGTDLKQQTPSLVNVLWLKSGDQRAHEFFSCDAISQEMSKEARVYLKSTSILDDARQVAKQYADRAENILKPVASEVKDQTSFNALRSLLKFTLNRCL